LAARRSLLGLLAFCAACAARASGPAVSIPEAQPGRVRATAVAVASTGSVQPIAVAVTNGEAELLHLDARQVYGHTDGEGRTAPLPPAEAAGLAAGHRAPAAVRGGVVGAATGGLLGAVGGAIAGAIQGGIGLAVAAGSAVGAFFGAVTGALGAGTTPDVAGFENRALHDTGLAPGFSATGYVYYPRGVYRSLEILLTNDPGEVQRVEIPIEPAP